ncbi:hypothetical protein [Syntrophomonas palmitatica]|uniref:hypothetical protein n=1 Tax=Syntrophomonas palmitatica TaxID=402877 RepID=UPI0006D12838|nr:hypothetical protein [Syntrophomonas palmitatica]
MKKMLKVLLVSLLLFVLMFSLIGCKGNKTKMDFSKSQSTNSTVTQDDEDMDMRYHRLNK